MAHKNVRRKYVFLIDDYGMKYDELIFSTDKSGSFLGPMFAHCFHNEHGVFIIYYALQRNEWYFYTADKYSTQQEELLQTDISDQVFKLLRENKYLFVSELSKLSIILKKQLRREPVLFGIPLE